MSGHDVKNIPKLILSFFHILPLKQNPTISRTICSPLNKWFLIPEPEWGGRQRRYKTKYSLGNNRSMTYQGFFFIKVGFLLVHTKNYKSRARLGYTTMSLCYIFSSNLWDGPLTGQKTTLFYESHFTSFKLVIFLHI